MSWNDLTQTLWLFPIAFCLNNDTIFCLLFILYSICFLCYNDGVIILIVYIVIVTGSPSDGPEPALFLSLNLFYCILSLVFMPNYHWSESNLWLLGSPECCSTICVTINGLYCSLIIILLYFIFFVFVLGFHRLTDWKGFGLFTLFQYTSNYVLFKSQFEVRLFRAFKKPAIKKLNNMTNEFVFGFE